MKKVNRTIEGISYELNATEEGLTCLDLDPGTFKVEFWYDNDNEINIYLEDADFYNDCECTDLPDDLLLKDYTELFIDELKEIIYNYNS